MTRHILTAAVAACFLAVAVHAQPAQDAAAPSRNTVKLSRVIIGLPAGAPWLSISVGGLFCIQNPTVQTWDGRREEQTLAPYAAAFKAEMERAGYAVVTPGENLFDADSTGAADYETAAVVTDAHFEGCMNNGLAFGSRGSVKGSGDLKVDWQVYSPLKKQVVARVSTSGSAKQEKEIPGGITVLIVQAFAENVRAFAANEQVRAALTGSSTLSGGALLPGKQDKIALGGSLKAARRPISDAVGSVVTVLTGSGSGSGDLVSNDGYMLTNAHVVGDEKSVRVRWSDGIETVAEVVRVIRSRDVALIKTNPRDREPLAIKRGPVTPGTRVYAIGSPLGKAYQGTVSAGIISATRTIDGLRYIQSDVAITHGSSGGALLDENGAMIGITVSTVEVGGPVGINFFIPIGDAMDFLNLEQN